MRSALPSRVIQSNRWGRSTRFNCVAGGDGEGNCDPHVWFNPYNIELWTLYIRDTLSELDPVNADTYATNTAAYLTQT